MEVTLSASNGTVTLDWASVTATTVGSEFRVNTTTSDRQATLDGEFYGGATNDFDTRSVASDATGNFVVTWSSKNQDGDGWGVYAQRYNSSGVAQGGEFRVNTSTAKDEVHASIAMNDAGNFVIAWGEQGSRRRQLGRSMRSATTPQAKSREPSFASIHTPAKNNSARAWRWPVAAAL